MKQLIAGLGAALAAVASAAPADNYERATAATPKVYLAGDSTMARGGGGAQTQGNKLLFPAQHSQQLTPTGWGEYLAYSLQGITVVNDAIAGRSARSYSDESRFTSMADVVTTGDYVIIEFGHNDGGSLSVDNGRSDCVGSGSETCTTAAGLVVQTYVTYLTNAAKAIIANGANVIISSPTPDNTCESGTCTYSPSRFTGYCKIVIQNAGAKASFVDHGQYVANEFAKLGADVVNGYYPIDHTHTSPTGANVVAAQFVKVVLCANDSFATHVKNTTASIDGKCL
jgi:rhamnogalacturonan acetylesterase